MSAVVVVRVERRGQGDLSEEHRQGWVARSQPRGDDDLGPRVEVAGEATQTELDGRALRSRLRMTPGRTSISSVAAASQRLREGRLRAWRGSDGPRGAGGPRGRGASRSIRRDGVALERGTSTAGSEADSARRPMSTASRRSPDGLGSPVPAGVGPRSFLVMVPSRHARAPRRRRGSPSACRRSFADPGARAPEEVVRAARAPSWVLDPWVAADVHGYRISVDGHAKSSRVGRVINAQQHIRSRPRRRGRPGVLQGQRDSRRLAASRDAAGEVGVAVGLSGVLHLRTRAAPSSETRKARAAAVSKHPSWPTVCPSLEAVIEELIGLDEVKVQRRRDGRVEHGDAGVVRVGARTSGLVEEQVHLRRACVREDHPPSAARRAAAYGASGTDRARDVRRRLRGAADLIIVWRRTQPSPPAMTTASSGSLARRRARTLWRPRTGPASLRVLDERSACQPRTACMSPR